MKGLCIINGFTSNPNNLYKARRMKEEFALLGIALDTISALDLLTLTDGKDILLASAAGYDFALDLDKDGYLADALETKMPVFNSARALHLSDDKILTLLALKGAGVKAPLTIAAPLCYAATPQKADVARFLDQVEARLGYPLVFKLAHGSMGKQVELIRNRQELEKVYEENRYTPHLYEKFLSSCPGRDYRVMVVGKKVVAAMERVNEHDFRSNIALGGKGYDAIDRIPSSYQDMALKASAVLGLDYAGIDIGIGPDGEGMFLEANGNAFFTEIEKVTHVNIARLLAEHIANRLKA